MKPRPRMSATGKLVSRGYGVPPVGPGHTFILRLDDQESFEALLSYFKPDIPYLENARLLGVRGPPVRITHCGFAAASIRDLYPICSGWLRRFGRDVPPSGVGLGSHRLDESLIHVRNCRNLGRTRRVVACSP
jgi:hypothetical protein